MKYQGLGQRRRAINVKNTARLDGAGTMTLFSVWKSEISKKPSLIRTGFLGTPFILTMFEYTKNRRNNKTAFTGFTLVLALLVSTSLQSQPVTSGGDLLQTIRPPLPANERDGSFATLDDELAMALVDEVNDLGLDQVAVGIFRDSSKTATKSRFYRFSSRYFLRELVLFKEAIVISGSTITQDTVIAASSGADGIVDWIKNKRGKNVTEISLSAYFVDIEKAEIIGTLEENGYAEESGAVKSKQKAIQILMEKLRRELKRIYWFSAEIVAIKGDRLAAPMGSKNGVFPGLRFDIIEPDRTYEDEEGEYIEPGGSAGLAQVVATSKDSSQLKVIRQWRDFYPESWLVEHPSPVYALQLLFVPPALQSYYSAGIGIHTRPIADLDWGLKLHFSSIEDSYEDADYGFGIGSFVIFRMLNTAFFDLGTIAGIGVDFPFRKDDNDQTVSTLLISASLGLSAEFPLSSQVDLISTAGYRFGLKSDTWDYNEDEESLPAYWEGEPPSVNNRGLAISVGFKFLLF